MHKRRVILYSSLVIAMALTTAGMSQTHVSANSTSEYFQRPISEKHTIVDATADSIANGRFIAYDMRNGPCTLLQDDRTVGLKCKLEAGKEYFVNVTHAPHLTVTGPDGETYNQSNDDTLGHDFYFTAKTSGDYTLNVSPTAEHNAEPVINIEFNVYQVLQDKQTERYVYPQKDLLDNFRVLTSSSDISAYVVKSSKNVESNVNISSHLNTYNPDIDYSHWIDARHYSWNNSKEFGSYYYSLGGYTYFEGRQSASNQNYNFDLKEAESNNNSMFHKNAGANTLLTIARQNESSSQAGYLDLKVNQYKYVGGFAVKAQLKLLNIFSRLKSFIGDPVDTYSGAFTDSRTLLGYGGNNPLQFNLNYNSVTNDSESLAGGFTHNFETKLVHDDDSVCVHWTPNTYSNFKKNADGSFTAEDEEQSSTKVSYQDNQYIVTTESDGMYVFNDKGFVVSHTDISGQETVYKYTDNQLISVSNNRGQSFVLSYESNHLKTVKDGNGHQLTFNYNSDYTHLDSINMPDDKKYEINYSAKDQVESLRYNNHTLIDNTYDIAGRVISQRDAKGITTSYSYDEYTNSNQLKTTHETNGVKTVFVHDLNGNLLSKTDGNNHTTSSEYDALNQKTADIDANNNKTVYQYDKEHHVSSQTDSLGRQKQFEYTNNLLTKVITADGSSATYAYNNKKQLVSSKDSAGHDISYSYTARGDLSKVISGDTSVENTYDDNGYLIATTKNGVTTKFVNDSQGRQVKIIAADGTTIEKTYDLNNNVLTSSVAGKTTKYTYDDFGNQVTVTSPTGHVVTNEYDDNQNLVTTTDGDNITRYSYNDSNQLTKASLNYEDVAQYTYDNAGQVLTSQKGTDNPIENSYDPNGNLIETKQGDNKSHYDYDGANQLITSTDALGRQIHLKYDVNGQVVEKTDADGQVTTYTYNQSNQVETMRQGSHEVTYGYDSAGNKISETDESNHQTTFEYNKDSQLVSATNALGYKTYYEYNQIGQLVKTYNNRHEMTMAYEYNATGQVTKLYDANGLAQTMTYDDSGKLLVAKDAEGNTVSSNVYDETDRLISTIGALNQKSEISYSSNGSSAVTTTTDSMGDQQSTTTDYAGRVTSNQDSQTTGNVKYNAQGLVESQSLGYDETNKTSYEYDVVGRVTKESNNDSAVSYTYNISDQIESWTNARGQATNYTYDSDGNVVSVKSDDIAIDYKFDQSGNMTEASDKNGAITKTYDALGRVISKTFNNQTIGYQYDDRGFMTELIYPGNKVVKSDYDTSGRVLSMTDWNGHMVKYTYDKLNRVVKTVNWNGLIEEKSYNNAGQVLTLKTSIKNNVITNYKYAYDSNGNLIKDNSVNYTYDTLSRLTAGKSSSSYSYDSIGNITAANNHNFEYDSDSRLKSVDYHDTTSDADGNLTDYTLDDKDHHATYDSQNRLTKYDNTEYNYDALGNRISAGNKQFVYDDNGNVLSDGTNTYVYGATGLVGYYNKDNQFITYVFNQRGDVVKEVNESGKTVNSFEYNDYGELTKSTVKPVSVFGYGGQYGAVTDDNGLIFLKTRYYNADLMRFMNRDTVSGSVTDTKSLNRFSYVEGNPLTNIDPNGQAATWINGS